VSDPTYTETADYYARYRPPHPPDFLAVIARRFSDAGAGRLLDLGRGPGTLTVALAGAFREAVGVDAEPDMLAEARRAADRAGLRNVAWIESRAEEISAELGQFSLVTVGRAFHWLDRERVLDALAGMTESGGGLVIVNDGFLIRPVTAWQRAIAEGSTAHAFLPISRPGQKAHLPSLCPSSRTWTARCRA
jgi:ubiquinone/menaquinone biosynthesis C-methylase UbiE